MSDQSNADTDVLLPFLMKFNHPEPISSSPEPCNLQFQNITSGSLDLNENDGHRDSTSQMMFSTFVMTPKQQQLQQQSAGGQFFPLHMSQPVLPTFTGGTASAHPMGAMPVTSFPMVFAQAQPQQQPMVQQQPQQQQQQQQQLQGFHQVFHPQQTMIPPSSSQTAVPQAYHQYGFPQQQTQHNLTQQRPQQPMFVVAQPQGYQIQNGFPQPPAMTAPQPFMSYQQPQQHQQQQTFWNGVSAQGTSYVIVPVSSMPQQHVFQQQQQHHQIPSPAPIQVPQAFLPQQQLPITHAPQPVCVQQVVQQQPQQQQVSQLHMTAPVIDKDTWEVPTDLPAEKQLQKYVECYVQQCNPQGTSSFVQIQTFLRENFGEVVRLGLLNFENSWHRWIASCPELTLLQYSPTDVERLGLRGWADEGELRIRFTTATGYEGVDQAKAAIHDQCVTLAQQLSIELVLARGPMDIMEVRNFLSQQIPYFSNLSKSALKRILLKVDDSPLWVTGNAVKPRRPSYRPK
eukprot:PhF_6_TR21238/c4_g1_i1/m.30714